MSPLRLSLLFVCTALALLPALAATLPQDHEYQIQLRQYLSTLKEEDFAVELKPFTVSPGQKTDEELYRFKVLAAFPAQFRSSLQKPAAQFTLAGIEAENGVRMPLNHVAGQSYIYSATWLVKWNYPGNPYYDSRPLKLRVFSAAAVDMIMHDNAHEKLRIGTRSDYLGGTLLWLACAYEVARDVLPPEAQTAYETGLIKFMHRINGWGPTGAMTDMDLFAAVSMRMVADLLKDPDLLRMAETYTKRLYSDPRFFNPAGYFVDNGCFDTSYNGISLFFTGWATMRSPDWPFIKEALEKAYNLKAHLMFPDPDGKYFGPSQCSSRTSACPAFDQWNFPPRDIAAGMMTDHALFLTQVPPRAQLQGAENQLISVLNGQVTGAYAEGDSNVWKETHWGPRPNHAYDFYTNGYYERRLKLEEEKSPLLKNPYQREGDFIQPFEKIFLTGKVGGYGFAIHTGPVSKGILGFGGGELCAFWTPKSGSVMLGRRRGWAAQTNKPELADSFEIWRMWPVHAVTGVTTDGNIFSSARIRNPNPVYTVEGQRAEVAVSAMIPQDLTNTKNPCLQGEVSYARHFTVDASGVAVETSVKSDGKDQVTEMYETLPVFLREGGYQAKTPPTAIQFRVGDAWCEPTVEPMENVTAVKLTRFTGAVQITFEKPQRVKLSPEVWADHYQSRAECRTILVDLLGNNGNAVAIPQVKVRYTISALKE